MFKKYVPTGFHFITPFNSDVSCSSVHGSVTGSFSGMGFAGDASG